jgi:hypothetical protein
MDQIIVAAFAVTAFGGAIIGYAIRCWEDRKIKITPDEDVAALSRRSRRAF